MAVSESPFIHYLKGLSIYRHVAKCRDLILGMSRNVQSTTEWRCLIYGLQQNVKKLQSNYSTNVTEYRNKVMLRNDLQINLVSYIS